MNGVEPSDAFWTSWKKRGLWERTIREKDALDAYSHDETPYLTPHMPHAVLTPQNSIEVQQAMQCCLEHHVAITPRGAGTGKSGGAVPVQGGVVLNMTAMNRILEISVENLTARVQPGVILKDFQDAVEALGLFYPPDPASLASCTLGGNVAENAGGPRALRYGVTGDYVIGLEVVLPTGELTRVGRQTSKGVAGYDLTSLIVGSEGTLAIVTEITVKLLPLPRGVVTALVTFSSSEKAIQAVSSTLAKGLLPRVLEYMDKRSLDAVRPLIQGLQLEAMAQAVLIVETDGSSEEAALADMEQVMESMKQHGVLNSHVALDAKQQRQLWHVRRSVSEATRKLRARKVSEDIVVPKSHIPALVTYAAAQGEAEGLDVFSFGHAGDGNLHLQVLFDRDEDYPRVEKLLHNIFTYTLSLGGTITGEHGVGIAKMLYLPMELSPSIMTLSKRIKYAFDPQGILNPGKFLR